MSERKLTKFELDCMKLVNEDAILTSLLYDLDLMPEQLARNSMNWGRMLCICEHWMKRFEKI